MTSAAHNSYPEATHLSLFSKFGALNTTIVAEALNFAASPIPRSHLSAPEPRQGFGAQVVDLEL